ncbi:ester cyclase, partial [Kibdelosporangium lantanae]
MSDDNLRDFYRRYLSLLNNRELDELSTLFHERVTLNGQPVNREDIMAAMRYTATEAVPDLQWTAQDVVVTGDRV